MTETSIASVVAEAAGTHLHLTESADLGGVAYPTFRRSDFRWSWMATRVHTFVFVINLPALSIEQAVDLAGQARTWARKHKGGVPAGLQSGTVAIPVFVTAEIGTEVWDWASSPQKARFASGLFPIVISADGRDAAYRRSSAKIGVVYESFLRGIARDLLAATNAI